MTEEERIKIHDWCIENFKYAKLEDNKIKNKKFYLLFLNNVNISINPLILEIKKRIEIKENLLYFEKANVLNDFIAYVYKDCKIHKHKDLNDKENELYQTRFNVFILNPFNKNFNTYYDNNIVETTEGSYAICRAGLDYHWTDVNNDFVPRITLSFGYMLPMWKINTLVPNL